MKIQVLYFASLAEKIGMQQQGLELQPNATVADAIEQLTVQHPSLESLKEGIATAVNMKYVDLEKVLTEGDELALIPPVSGG